MLSVVVDLSYVHGGLTTGFEHLFIDQIYEAAHFTKSDSGLCVDIREFAYMTKQKKMLT